MHTSALAGHFGTCKTRDRLNKHFVWPGLWKSVKDYCSSCTSCQRASRNCEVKVTMQEVPCISRPFERTRLRPLPKTAKGHMYLLTAMYLYTHYPEAIPFRKIDAHSVVEGILEIFSRHGLPESILTDHGD